MLVRIRFSKGPLVTRRKGKNSRAALLLGSSLTLVAISCFSLGAWRLGRDLNLTGDFAFASGFFSHWQVWIAAATVSQYSCWRLNRYARQAELAEAPAEVPAGT